MQTEHKYVKWSDSMNGETGGRMAQTFQNNRGDLRKSDCERSMINFGIDLCIFYC